ncbi:hypothetical protein MPH_12951 [Macrophomina phaseolina MS6]|uniref:Uncharacterized protein n=1 Tax=Macrophomina phaseolina (strain MS6) TaxID=1126212 RepID=K2RIR7_MACPH|nr:hypothetical protein MPH_12951 [Macrophomina phaseolina MS6]
MVYTKGSAVPLVAASLFYSGLSSPANLKAPGLSSIACSLGSGEAHFKANEDSYFSLARTIQPTELIYAVGNGSNQSCWSVMPKDTTSSFCLKATEGYSVDSIGVSTIVSGIYFSCRAGGDTNTDTKSYACPYDGQHLVGVGYLDGGSVFLCMP